MTVTGHVEKLQQSACKQSAGDKLWCGTCHDPHGARQSMRETCLGCHACKARNNDACTGCHMPKSRVRDAQHVVYTDHSIPRRPRVAAAAARGDLIGFAGFSRTARDLALAYAVAAARADGAAERPRVLALLQQAERANPDDAEILVYLAEIYRNTGKPDEAIPLYERALRLDPAQLTASVGLGGIRMERGEFAAAVRLWEDALTKDAGLVLVRTNLAMAFWQLGDLRSAKRHLVKAVALAPGLAAPAELLEKVRQASR
jgi:tetratricopeptide (TPR) repeat protein